MNFHVVDVVVENLDDVDAAVILEAVDIVVAPATVGIADAAGTAHTAEHVDTEGVVESLGFAVDTVQAVHVAVVAEVLAVVDGSKAAELWTHGLAQGPSTALASEFHPHVTGSPR